MPPRSSFRHQNIELLAGAEVHSPDLVAQRSHVFSIREQTRLNQGLREGDSLSRERGEGLELDEIRTFQEGDSPRHIDWRVTARSGTLHTRQYRRETETPAIIFLDLSPCMHFGSRHSFKSVMAAQLAALIGWNYRRHKRLVGGVVLQNGHIHNIKPGNDAALLQLFSAAASAQGETGDGDFDQALTAISKLSARGSICYLISDFQSIDENHEAHFSAIGLKSTTYAVRIRDALELNPPSQRLPIRVGNKIKWVDSVHITQQADILNDRFQRFTQGARIRYRDYSPGSPITDLQDLL